jgi:putative ABC transport system permease protein
VHNQLRYVLNRQLGFDKEQVLVVNRAQALGEQREAFRQRLLQNPDIVSAATSATLPGKMFGRSTYRGLEAPSEESHGMHQIYVDEDFMATLGIDLVVGRNFSRDFATDSSAVLLNETAAQKFGWADPIGRQLIRPGNAEWLGTIIGVVKDFHFESLHKPIQPLVIRHEPFFQYFSVRVRPEKVASAVEFVGSVWQEFAPQQPFEYSFLDTDLDRLYRAEQRTGQIFGIFAALAIFVACLGQFGLTAYTIERRTKEIGIRKVLGASVAGISALLSKEFVKLILVAIVIASPVAYYAMTRWLQHFAYRVEIDLWVFALAGGLALIIALLTVSAQAIKAALANPVESLKYE